MPKRLTTEEFVFKAKKIHNDKYDYSKVEYVNNSTKVCIICPEHGEFWQTSGSHLSGHGCPMCKNENTSKISKYTKDNFIKKANDVHNGKYNYSKVEYVNSHTKICIICPEHGEFWQLPYSHLQGQGCHKCGKIIRVKNALSNTDDFIKKAKQVHDDKYDYSKVEYMNSQTKVCIICYEHGEFWQSPNHHLKKRGCPKCAIKYRSQKLKSNTNEFILKSKQVHGDKYDYSKVNYVNTFKKVCIGCNKHGYFFVRPGDHINLKSGCPKCNSSHMEIEIRELLNNNHILFEEQKSFDWLGKQSLDFYLPDYNIAIECQGVQHFEPVGYFGSYETFKLTQERDKRKKILCKENGIKILYYANYEYDFPYEVITENNALIEKIDECTLIK